MADFTALLATQKQQQEKEQVAISEAAQDYALKVQLEEGLTQDFLKGGPSKSIKGETEPSKRIPISNAAISIVRNFQQDLDMIADVSSISEFKSIIGKYQTLLENLPASYEKNRFSEREVQYISKVIAPVLAELHPLTNSFAKVRFGFKNFIKQFKPIKIADRVLGNFPILGRMIKDAIETKEAGESELRRAERQRGKDIATEARRSGEEKVSGELGTSSAILSDISSDVKEVKEEVSKPTPISEIETQYGLGDKTVPGMTSKSVTEETQEEEALVDKVQHEENRNLFEIIAENTTETNVLLEELLKGGDGGLMETAGATAIGAGVGGTAGVAGTLGAAKLLKSKTPVKGGKPTKTNFASKAKNLAKSTVKKSGSVMKNTARVAGRVASRAFLPLMAGLAIWDAAKGVANAAEILGKEKEDLTLRDKAAAGTGSLLEGLSFGLIKKDKVAKFLAGKQDSQKVVDDVIPDKSALESGGVAENKNLKDVVNIDSKRTIVRTILETENLENLIKKMLPDNSKNNNAVYQDNKQVMTTNTHQLLSDMSALNANFTVKNVGANNE
jgi:hypothetical protein